MRHWLAIRFWLAVVASLATGCCTFHHRSDWAIPELAAPDALSYRAGGILSRPRDPAYTGVTAAEAAYARAIAAEKADDAGCVDQFFLAAALIWPRYEAIWLSGGADAASCRETELYRSSVIGLVTAAQRFGRLDDRQSLLIHTPQGDFQVPLEYHGLVWVPEEIGRFVPVGPYESDRLIHIYRGGGMGVPFIGTYRDVGRHPGPSYWLPKQLPFSLTGVLRTDTAAVRHAFALPADDPSPTPLTAGQSDAQLAIFDWYDPLRCDVVAHTTTPIALARDLSAPFAFMFDNKPFNPIEQYLLPGGFSNDDGLRLLEPWQPGKMPVLFVHGLMSDPMTWLAIANELRADPGFRAHYQLVGFRYSTGAPFLRSALRLREEFHTMAATFGGPPGAAATGPWILVGHSMGGLVSKLQVTSSGDRLWRAFAHKPFEEMDLTPSQQQLLSRAFFFEPQPLVSTVVYIATPHRGSRWATRPVGRLASQLVNEPSDVSGEFRQIVARNPDAFDWSPLRRMPTSVDLLTPGNSALKAIEKLPVAPTVHQYSIIGVGYPTITDWSDDNDGDTVVPINSARVPGVEWEVRVRAHHDDILRNQHTVTALLDILETERARQGK